VRNVDFWSKDPINAQHFIIKDALHMHNGLWVPDNRDKFNFGTSNYVTKSECKSLLCALFAQLAESATISLVGHSIAKDLHWLVDMGVTIPTNITQCDIAQVDCANRQDSQRRKLSKMLAEYRIEYCSLHNGGNDAFYTLACAMKMMEEEERVRMDNEGL